MGAAGTRGQVNWGCMQGLWEGKVVRHWAGGAWAGRWGVQGAGRETAGTREGRWGKPQNPGTHIQCVMLGCSEACRHRQHAW